MVKNTFSQRIRGSSEISLPQDMLAIFLSDQRLQFVVADHLGQAQLLREYVSEEDIKFTAFLKEVFSEDQTIRKAYNQAYLILKQPLAVLEPLTLDQEGSELSKYLLPDIKGFSKLSDSIDSSGIKVIYPFEESSRSFVLQMFPNLTIYHHHTLLIQLFDRISENLPGDRIFVQLESTGLSIFYYKNSKLQYGNQFQAHTDEDRIYYIMLIYNQFDLDPSTVMLSLSSGSGVSGMIIPKMRTYIQHIQILEHQPSSVHSPPILQDSTSYKQYYFPLSSLSILTRVKTI